MVLSTGVPSLADRRYFLSQISSDASWKGIASTSLCSSLTTLFMDWVPVPEVSDPFFRTRITPTPEPEKEKTHTPDFWMFNASLCEVTAVRQPPISSPRLPNHPDV